jgi:hypothetical protein
MKKKYGVLLVDVVDSRKYESSHKLQQILQRSMQYLNKIYEKYLLSEVTFEAGDSVQGLFSKSFAAFLYYRMLGLLVYPIQIRGSVGYGEIDYYDQALQTNALNGEAYHFAREGLKQVHSKELLMRCIYISRKEDKYINLLLESQRSIQRSQNSSAWLVSLMTEMLSPIQQDIELDYESEYESVKEIVESGGRTINFLAKELSGQQGVNVQVIYEKMQDSQVWEEDNFTPRGLQNIVAKMMEVSRQNISKHFMQTIRSERKYTAAIITMLNKMEENE